MATCPEIGACAACFPRTSQSAVDDYFESRAPMITPANRTKSAPDPTNIRRLYTSLTPGGKTITRLSAGVGRGPGFPDEHTAAAPPAGAHPAAWYGRRRWQTRRRLTPRNAPSLLIHASGA